MNVGTRKNPKDLEQYLTHGPLAEEFRSIREVPTIAPPPHHFLLGCLAPIVPSQKLPLSSFPLRDKRAERAKCLCLHDVSGPEENCFGESQLNTLQPTILRFGHVLVLLLPPSR